ncbi:ROK family protein [Pseudarthrobacter sp. MEB009]|uniref:ROK family protein n=1 Tax=Pseudarthrobacter sp. MEB009 TaxID=3040326 RepID=UPI002556A7F1|nr:ROK family protein [Pseudarthrobacter sp. MEB009]
MPRGTGAVQPAAGSMRIGVDIGGTKTEAVAIDEHNTVLCSLRRPTGQGNSGVLRTLFAAVAELREAEILAPYRLAGLGIGVPGAVDPATGKVSNAVNIGVAELELGALAEAGLGLKVHVENDVNAAALGAHHLLSDRTCADQGSSAYLNLGTGLAAGLISNGGLVRGAAGAAGEIGHLPLGITQEPCPCGQTGCLELIASGSGIARQWTGDGEFPAVSLFEHALLGEPLAVAVQDRFFRGAAAAIRVLGLSVDPAVIYIGGGLNALGEPLLEGIHRELARTAGLSPFIAGLGLGRRVRLVPPGLPIGSAGAALAATG